MLAAVLVALLALVGGGVPAAGAATPTLTGHVTDGGAPVAGLRVWVYQGASQTFVTSTLTDASGAYALALPAGSYRLQFWLSTMPYAPTWYPGAPTYALGSTVAVPADGSVAVADQAVSPAGSVAGTVTAAGTPSAGASVWLFTPAGQWVYGTTTSATGTYTLPKVLPGTYRLQVWSTTAAFPATWYPHAASLAGAADLVVPAAGALTGIDVDVATRGTVAGHVVDGATGLPLAGQRVWLYTSTDALVNVVYTDSAGAYSIGSVDPGSYLVLLSDPTGTYAAGAWWPTSPDRAGAGQLAVTAGATSIADFTTYLPADQPIPPYTGGPGPTVAVLGDSITQMSTTAIHTAIDPIAEVSVVGINNQRFDQLQPVAERYGATAPDQVVIALGTNDAGQGRPLVDTQAAVETMLATFPSASCITVLTPTDATGLANYNEAVGPLIDYLRSLPDLDPRVQVADWERVLGEHMSAGEPGGRWTIDTVHLTPLGQVQYAALMRAGVESCGAPSGSLAGTVFDDLDGNGVWDSGEGPLTGATVRVRGRDVLSGLVDRTVVTGADGSWLVDGLRAGTYDVVVDDLAGYARPASTPGTLAGTVTTDGVSGVVLTPGAVGTGYDFAMAPGPGSLAAAVFADVDLDGVRDVGEPGIPGVVLTLTGTDLGAVPVPERTALTDDSGGVTFSGLRPGTYQVAETSPYGHTPTGVSVGSLGGVAGTGAVADIGVGLGSTGTDYLFGERLPDAAAWLVTGKGAGAGLGRATAVAPDGSSYVTGVFTGSLTLGLGTAAVTLTSAGDTDLFLARYDTNSNLVWARRAGGTGPDEGDDVAVDPVTGDVVVSGGVHGAVTFASTGGDQAVAAPANAGIVARYAADGTLVWTRALGAPASAVAAGLTVDGSGDAYVTGWYTGGDLDVAGVATLSPQGGTEGFVVRLAPDGSLRWATPLHSPTVILPFDVAVRSDGSLLVAGGHGGFSVAEGTLPTQGGLDVFVAALGTDGSLLAVGSYGSAATDAALGVAVDPATDDAYVSGVFSGTVYFGGPTRTTAGETDAFVLALDAAGATRWVRSAGGPEADIGTRVAVGGGHVYTAGIARGTGTLGGVTSVGLGGDDGFAASYATDGTFEWVRRVAGTGSESGWGIAAVPDGGAVATGSYQWSSVLMPGPSQVPLPSTFYPQVYVVRLNP